MSKALRWTGWTVLGLLAVVIIAAIVLYLLGTARLGRSYDLTVATLTVPEDDATIARGRHLAETVAICTGCHGENLAGTLMADEPNLFKLVAPNLTRGRGGVGADLTIEDFVRAIRHGVGRSGSGLLVMHSDAYNNLAERDLAALIAFVRSVPPNDNEMGETSVAPLGRVLFALGMFDSETGPVLPAEVIDHDAPFAAAPREGPTAEYGDYLVSISLCYLCHGSDLRGAAPFEEGMPAGPDVVGWAASESHTLSDFGQLLRSGVTPAGRHIDPEHMPWEYFSGLTDVEITAIWRSLRAAAPGASEP